MPVPLATAVYPPLPAGCAASLRLRGGGAAR
jgi:hypothetical protein